MSKMFFMRAMVPYLDLLSRRYISFYSQMNEAWKSLKVYSPITQICASYHLSGSFLCSWNWASIHFHYIMTASWSVVTCLLSWPRARRSPLLSVPCACPWSPWFWTSSAPFPPHLSFWPDSPSDNVIHDFSTILDSHLYNFLYLKFIALHWI